MANTAQAFSNISSFNKVEKINIVKKNINQQ